LRNAKIDMSSPQCTKSIFLRAAFFIALPSSLQRDVEFWLCVQHDLIAMLGDHSQPDVVFLLILNEKRFKNSNGKMQRSNFIFIVRKDPH